MDTLTCLLMDTAKILKTSLTKALKQYNLTCRQAIVLRTLENESLSAKEIGDDCSIDKATLSAILDKLIEHNYIIHIQDKEDKRKKIYTATKSALDILPKISNVEQTYIKQFKKILSDEEYKQIILSLDKINSTLN